jgi:hypothetical protein
MQKEGLSTDTIFNPSYFSLDYTFKGVVQWDLTGVKSGINPYSFI